MTTAEDIATAVFYAWRSRREWKSDWSRGYHQGTLMGAFAYLIRNRGQRTAFRARLRDLVKAYRHTRRYAQRGTNNT